jgi:hypothetical protein
MYVKEGKGRKQMARNRMEREMEREEVCKRD